MFDQLMKLNQESFDQRRYDAAYHLLVAAMDYALYKNDEAGLQLVEATAIKQIARIDEIAPDYRHSTKSAAGRGMETIFAMLARQASAKQATVSIRLRDEVRGAKGRD